MFIGANSARVAAVLRQLCLEHGFSGDEFYRLAGKPKSSGWSILNGRKDLRIDSDLAPAAAVFGMTAAELLSIEPNELGPLGVLSGCFAAASSDIESKGAAR